MGWEALKSAVTAVITSNGDQEITGQILQNLINDNLIPQLGSLQFKGVATPDTIPDTSDREFFYISSGFGLFTNFNVTVPIGKTVILHKNSIGVWGYVVLFDSSENTTSSQTKFSPTLSVGINPNTGASNSGNTLIIPVGQNGSGSNVGAYGNWALALPDANILSNQVDEIVVYTVLGISGADTEITTKLKPLIVEQWSDGNIARSDTFINQKIADGKYLLAARLNRIQERSQNRDAVFNRLFVGYTVTSETTAQEIRAEVLDSSSFTISLVGVSEGITDLVTNKKIASKLSDFEFDNTYAPKLEYLYAKTAAGSANDVVLGTSAEGKNTMSVVANGNPFGMHAGMTGYVVPANTRTLLEVLVKLTTIPKENLKLYFINFRGGVRYVENCDIKALGDGYYVFSKIVDYGEASTVDLLGFQYVQSATFTTPIEVVVLDFRASILENSIENIENLPTQKINSKIAESVSNIYNPSLSLEDYNLYYLAQSGTATSLAVISTNSDGKKVATVAPNSNLFGLNMGMQDLIIPANTPTRVEVLIELVNLPITNVTKYFIYHVNGSRVVENCSFTDLGNNCYLFYKEINNTDEIELDILGFQYSSTNTFTDEVVVTLHEFKVIGVDIKPKTTLENDTTWKINKRISDAAPPRIKTTEINVSLNANDTGYAFTGNNAIQEALNSITDNSEFNRYQINVSKGIGKVVNSSQYIGNIGYPAMVVMKDYVDVIGVGEDETILWAELPYEDADIDTSTIRNLHQTVWNWAKDARLENITLVAKNVRYTVHQDSRLSIDGKRYYKNVNLIFIGDKGSLAPWGLGTFSGEETYVEGGYTRSSRTHAWACHNNTKFEKPSVWSFRNHRFITETATRIFNIQNLGSLVSDRLYLEGCSFQGRGYRMNYMENWLRGLGDKSSFNHAEYRIMGHANDPFLFVNEVQGYSLKVTSNTQGSNSTVRFTNSGEGYETLIKNPINLTENLIFPELKYIDGYIAKDGSTGLNGYAFGNVDISERIYTYETENFTSMGKRLGDCSTVNKFLTIEVDGVNKAIVFDRDYTCVSNSDILAEVNTVLGTSATAELFSYGKEYYPEMPDVMESVYNDSTTAPVLRGEVVTQINGRVRKAAIGDRIFGVALDDIPVLSDNAGEITGKGRVLKRGYINTDTSRRFHVKTTGNTNVGNTFSVNNGVLVNDVNGTVWVRENGILAINC